MKILRLKSGYNTDKEEVLFRNPKDVAEMGKELRHRKASLRWIP